MSLWWSGRGWSSLHVQIYRVRLPATLILFSLYRFFLFCVCFLTLFFLSVCFPLFLLLTGSIPEFYFGKGISRALGLRPEKTISCQGMSLLWNTWIFFDVSWHQDKQHTVHHKLLVVVYTQQPPVTHWRKLNLPVEHRLNRQWYYYPKISTVFAPQK